MVRRFIYFFSLPSRASLTSRLMAAAGMTLRKVGVRPANSSLRVRVLMRGKKPGMEELPGRL